MSRFLASALLASLVISIAAGCNNSPTSPTSTAPTVQAGPVADDGRIDPGARAGTTGAIANFVGDRSSFQFTLGGQSVRGDRSTDVASGLSLRDGVNVRVAGWLKGEHLFATAISAN